MHAKPAKGLPYLFLFLFLPALRSVWTSATFYCCRRRNRGYLSSCKTAKLVNMGHTHTVPQVRAWGRVMSGWTTSSCTLVLDTALSTVQRQGHRKHEGTPVTAEETEPLILRSSLHSTLSFTAAKTRGGGGGEEAVSGRKSK